MGNGEKESVWRRGVSDSVTSFLKIVSGVFGREAAAEEAAAAATVFLVIVRDLTA